MFFRQSVQFKMLNKRYVHTCYVRISCLIPLGKLCSVITEEAKAEFRLAEASLCLASYWLTLDYHGKMGRGSVLEKQRRV